MKTDVPWGFTVYQYKLEEMEMLKDLLKVNSIHGSLSIMISMNVINPTQDELLNLWVCKAEQIKNGTYQEPKDLPDGLTLIK